MVDLDALEAIAELTFPARAKIIRDAITELRELRALRERVEGAPVQIVRGDAFHGFWLDQYQGRETNDRVSVVANKRVRLVVEDEQ